MKNRDLFFDVVKFVAMFMVVWWHVLQCVQDRTVLSYAVNFIVGVNMPLFFLLSGYFSRRMVIGVDWMRFRKRLLNYFWPVVAFSIISVILLWVRQGGFTFGYAINRLVLFILRGWFFYALALCEGLTLCAVWLSRRYAFHVGWALFVVWLGLLFLPRCVWHVNGTVAMIPFYWVGLWGGFVARKDGRFKLIGAICLMGYAGACFLAGNFWENGLAFYGHRFVGLHPDFHELGLLFARYALGLMGVVGFMGGLRVVVDVVPAVLHVAWFGQITLGVYFIHRYFIDVWARHMLWDNQMVICVWVAVAIYLLSAAFVGITRRYHYLRFAFWGP